MYLVGNKTLRKSENRFLYPYIITVNILNTNREHIKQLTQLCMFENYKSTRLAFKHERANFRFLIIILMRLFVIFRKS